MPGLMKFNLPNIVAAVRSLDYRAKLILEEGYSAIESSNAGKKFYILCGATDREPLTDKKTEAAYLKFQTKWVDLIDYKESELDQLCNWFNARRMLSKLYRVEREFCSDLVLEADVLIFEGLSEASFQVIFSVFAEHLEMCQYGLKHTPSVDKLRVIDQHNVAINLLNSTDLEPHQAVQMYRENAHLCYAGSQNNFGDLFETGKIVPKDEHLAVYWYTRSSERGEPTAYLSLASLLSRSSDNTDALTTAAQYAIMASKYLPDGINKRSAIEIRDKLRESLDSELYAYAQQLADNYRPLYDERWKMGDKPSANTAAAQ